MGTALGMKPTALHRHSQLISRGHSNANIGYQGLQPPHLVPHPLGAAPHTQPSLQGSPLRHKSQPFSPPPHFFSIWTFLPLPTRSGRAGARKELEGFKCCGEV